MIKQQQEQEDDLWDVFGSSSDDGEEGGDDDGEEEDAEQGEASIDVGFEIVDYDKEGQSTMASSLSPQSLPRRGKGVRVTRSFTRGEEILREAPTLKVANCHAASSRQQAEELHAQAVQAAYDQLSTEIQRSIMNLSNCGKYHNTSPEITDPLLQGIYQTNSYRLMDDDGNAQTDGAMFLTIARFNHSCRPNCSHYWRSDLNCMILFAARDIVPGEELVISYLRPSHWMNTAERRQRLRLDFSFYCTCEMCTEGNAHGGDERMLRLSRLQESLLELVEMERDQQVIQVVEKCLDLLDKQGIGSALEQTYFYRFGYQSALRLKDLSLAKSFQEQELQSAIHSQGLQSPMAEQIRRQIKEKALLLASS